MEDLGLVPELKIPTWRRIIHSFPLILPGKSPWTENAKKRPYYRCHGYKISHRNNSKFIKSWMVTSHARYRDLHLVRIHSHVLNHLCQPADNCTILISVRVGLHQNMRSLNINHYLTYKI